MTNNATNEKGGNNGKNCRAKSQHQNNNDSKENKLRGWWAWIQSDSIWKYSWECISPLPFWSVQTKPTIVGWLRASKQASHHDPFGCLAALKLFFGLLDALADAERIGCSSAAASAQVFRMWTLQRLNLRTGNSGPIRCKHTASSITPSNSANKAKLRFICSDEGLGKRIAHVSSPNSVVNRKLCSLHCTSEEWISASKTWYRK